MSDSNRRKRLPSREVDPHAVFEAKSTEWGPQNEALPEYGESGRKVSRGGATEDVSLADELPGSGSADSERSVGGAIPPAASPSDSYLHKPRLLDLFCGAGGAAMGYHRAGFEVVGVDIKPQPRYPFEFHQGDALDQFEDMRVFDAWDFDAIHASPPCQAHVKGMAAVNHSLGRENAHVDLISATRELLRATDLPYVIENVVGAPLENPVQLCGSSFNLAVRRHRLFECSFPVMVPPCDHSRQNGDYWTSFRPNGEVRRSKVMQVYGQAAERDKWGDGMGIDWMEPDELAEAIPPAYTEHIGEYLMAEVREKTRPRPRFPLFRSGRSDVAAECREKHRSGERN